MTAAGSHVRTRGLASRPTIVALAVAVAVAVFIGFRIPNAWSATLDAVSLTDGFHRRFLVGTLLRPLAIATDYNYWLFAGYSFVVLAALLAVIVRGVIETRAFAARLIVVAYFLLPAGAFVFHEVGYFEQTLYLMLFIAIWLVHRQHVLVAAVVMAMTPIVHEIAIVSIIPIFGVVVLREVPFRRAFLATLPAALVNLVVLSLAPAGPEAVHTLSTALHGANFSYRTDALELFTRSQAEALAIYSTHELVVTVLPVAIAVLLAFGALRATAPEFFTRAGPLPRAAMFALSCVAIAAPAVLIWGGFDDNRWIFLLVTNFTIVVWLTLAGASSEPPPAAIAVLTAAMLVLAQVHPYYFNPDKPRSLDFHAVHRFVHDVHSGALFTIKDW